MRFESSQIPIRIVYGSYTSRIRLVYQCIPFAAESYTKRIRLHTSRIRSYTIRFRAVPASYTIVYESYTMGIRLVSNRFGVVHESEAIVYDSYMVGMRSVAESLQIRTRAVYDRIRIVYGWTRIVSESHTSRKRSYTLGIRLGIGATSYRSHCVRNDNRMQVCAAAPRGGAPPRGDCENSARGAHLSVELTWRLPKISTQPLLQRDRARR